MVETSRTEQIELLQQERQTKAILYVTSDRHDARAQIADDAVDAFVDHLDDIGPTYKISLVLQTLGGSTPAAWRLINLVRMFCDELEVIAPEKCMSAGTLIALGADKIVMTKQATLGPIDPSIQHPLSPQIPGVAGHSPCPVSVESVNSYLDAVRERGGTIDAALQELSRQIHPLVLGETFRSTRQIRELAEKLLTKSKKRPEDIRKLVDFLCSDSGSHDYTINRREAKDLGLPIEKCSRDLYKILKKLKFSYSELMKLREPFDLDLLQGGESSIEMTHAIIESENMASRFIAKYDIMRGQQGVSLSATRSGWKETDEKP